MGITTDIIALGTGIFTAIAARAAWKSAKVSAQQLTDQKEDQMKTERPRLVPLNQFVSPHPKEILSDWKTSTEIDYTFTDFYTNFSNVKIPIINTGKSFAIDINYSFSLEGGIEAIKTYSSEKTKISISRFPEEEAKIRMLQTDSFNIQVYDFDSDHARKDDNRVKTSFFHIAPYKRHISLIKTNETDELYIPNYFVVLCNIYLQEYDYIEKHNELIRPKIRLNIQYKDQYNEIHTDQYMMELSTKQFEGRNYSYPFEAWIDFIFIKPVNKQKNYPH